MERFSVGRGFGGALGLALSMCALPAQATDAQHFSWSWVRLPGAESCAAAELIADGVRERLGRDPFVSSGERHIEGWVERSEARWLAHLNITGPDGGSLGARQLESSEATCATLVDAVTLAVVLMIDPNASLAPRPPKSATEAAPAQTPAPDPTPARAEPPQPAPTDVLSRQAATACELSPQPPHPDAQPLGVRSALRALAVWGMLPRVSAGVEVGAELGISRRIAIATAAGFLPSVRTHDRRFGFGLMAASLGPCVPLVVQGRTRLGFCVEAQLGAIQAVNYDDDIDPLPPANHFWFALRGGTRLQQRLVGPLGFELSAQALVPVIRHEFTVRRTNEPVYQAKALGFWGGAGLAVSIP